jgi:hypothetical protein
VVFSVTREAVSPTGMNFPAIGKVPAPLEDPKVTDRTRRVLLLHEIAVQCMINIPESKMIVNAVAQVFLDFGSIPIRLPWEGFPIPQ